MKTIVYYEVYKNSDSVEGRGHSVPVVRFKAIQDAHELAESKKFYERHGCMGTKGGIGVSKKEVLVYESIDEYKEIHGKEELKRIALAKLTDEDKKVLGLI
jgi:hypothetical protein